MNGFCQFSDFTNVGPEWTKQINKDLDAMYRNIRQSKIYFCKNSIAAEEAAQANSTACEDIIAAKKEIVGLHLDAEYRARLKEAYVQVKKSLDYQVEVKEIVTLLKISKLITLIMPDWFIGPLGVP